MAYPASPSSRKAGIEIYDLWIADYTGKGRLPHGRRGLKSRIEKSIEEEQSRLPHGRRGLKCQAVETLEREKAVAFLTEGGD